ncbi:MAG: hypothetical protein RBU30_20150, partial [Polyangia bacterium]|nr:hypothetical protein [Polyangia bacterium]
MSPVEVNGDQGREILLQVEGEKKLIPSGTELRSLVPADRLRGPGEVLAALYNQRVASLSYRPSSGGTVEWLTFGDRHGWDVYRRSACLMLQAAVKRA